MAKKMLKCNKRCCFMIQTPVLTPSCYVPYYIYSSHIFIFEVSPPRQRRIVSFSHSNARFFGQ